MQATSILLIILNAIPALYAQGPPGGGPGGVSGDGIWRRNAAYGEIRTFDSCLGHQPGSGTYHYHVNPVCEPSLAITSSL